MPAPDNRDITAGNGWPLGVSEWTLRESSTERALRRLAAAGYLGVELMSTPDIDIEAGRRLLAASGLTALAICPMYGPHRNFASPVAVDRRAAADLLRHSVDYAVAVGAAIVIVVPSDTPKAFDRRDADSRQRAADTVRLVADDIGEDGPTLVIEPLNRYESALVTTVAQAVELCGLIGSQKVAVMADTFHMNIEEADVRSALRTAGNDLRHVHLADNHRHEPGSGSLDLAAMLTDLRAAGYRGSLVIEAVPGTDAALAAGRRHVETLVERIGCL